MTRNIVIMGAAGRDFHNFNVVFKNDEAHRVVAFTAAQIPDIDGRIYPAELAGPRYPQGIPILPEDDLPRLIAQEGIHEVVFSYSDVSHETVMHRASLALAPGADFRLLAPAVTQIKGSKPVVAVCAVRTGCGKSPVTLAVCDMLRKHGHTPVVVRHPMPYGDLAKQAVQRFASLADMDAADCTIEEREEYEHLVEHGLTVFAGVDYQRILAAAEKEADIIVWDGGNNDSAFFKPDVQITVLDPLRAGHETRYHPGEVNMRLADIALINKVNTASPDQVESVRKAVQLCRDEACKDASIILGASIISVESPEAVKGKRVLLVEDGPTLTHGEMGFGAATVAARQYSAAEVVDPRPAAQGAIADAYAAYPHLGLALPAMGYSGQQLADLETTINSTNCDLVLIGTPIRLDRLITITKPHMRVRYSYADHDGGSLEKTLLERLNLSK
ncbi:cyclic 2,3-diphosphoglycerate synthase [Oleidesulfovibrio sp.]|uniref:cyclic 2,3-diphosphoglycerate synthase n=1 Tax=Oleidesulfovibrio sp. TaxID=2909707 RepID=UPI003A84918F